MKPANPTRVSAPLPPTVRRRRLAAITAAAAAIAVLAACAGPSEPQGSQITTLRLAVSSFALSGNWNPETSTYLNLYFLPQQAVYESFIRLDPATYEFEPQLAETFEISDDRRSMSIKLREDVDFSDGTHLDADAAKKSFDAALAGETHGALVGFETELEVVGEYELKVTAAVAMGTDFLYWFGIVPIASPIALEEDPTGLEGTPVGTGPYVLDEEVVEVSTSFVRNPRYRDPDAYPFEEVEFLVFQDPIAISNALKSGQLDAGEITPEYATDLESSGLQLHEGAGLSVLLQWCDSAGSISPPLADARVRQAIAFAIDRVSIVETIEYGFGSSITQTWAEGSPLHIEGADDTYTYDLDRARDLMEEAGFGDGFELTMPTETSLVARYQPVIEQALADIGITVTWESFPDVPAYSDAINQGEYALALRDSSDLYVDGNLRLPPKGIPAGIPALAPLYEVVDQGTVEEAAAANQEIGRRVLDEAYVIVVSRPASIWATIPGIAMEPVVVAWGPLLEGFQPTD